MTAALLALLLLAPAHAKKPPPVTRKDVQAIQVKLRDLIELVPREGARGQLSAILERLVAIEARLTAIEGRLPAAPPEIKAPSR